jgi:sortase (surface protein transpeptidase)
MEVPARHRRALSTVLALILAVESVSAVAAAGLQTAGRMAGAPSGFSAPVSAAIVAAQGSAATDPSATDRVSGATMAGEPTTAQGPSAAPDSPSVTAPTVLRPTVDASLRARSGEPDPVRTRATRATKSTSRGSGSAVLKGRNHVWIPSLGVSRSVAWFPCSRAAEPGNLVYRWGCAGSNNVYLLGHAWGVFKPLHDAYTRGRLHAGMKAYYADAKGKVHAYAVRLWRVVAPTTAASWAWAAQSTPSMTLQTCVGRNSAYRLMVRLVEVGR